MNELELTEIKIYGASKMLKWICLLLILFFSGCQISSGFEYWDYDFNDDIEIVSVEQAHTFCYRNIIYVKDDSESWQLPHKTLQSGKGDCEDFSLLYMFLVYKHLGVESYMVRTEYRNTGHFLVQLPDRRYVDPMKYLGGPGYTLQPSVKITDRYNYGRAIFIALVR